MTELVFTLITDWGVYVIFASAFLSCLALPVPTSLMMLTGGALIASGDMDVRSVIPAAWAGAVIGDQTGYWLGRTGGAALAERLARAPARAAVLARARALVDRHGGKGVFLSTWAIAPLGPWVNFIAGSTGLGWLRFTLWDVLGETIWVCLYVTLGYVFMDRITTVSELMGDVIGLVMALAVVAGALFWIRGVIRGKRAEARKDAATDTQPMVNSGLKY